jgi:ribosomal protein L33
MAKAKAKFILVLMQSLSGSGHCFATKRVRLADKLDMYRFDPLVRQWVVYREQKKLKSLKESSR